LISYRAAWVLPIGTAPIRDGWLTVHKGRVVGVGPGKHVGNGRDEDLGRVAVLPGLVNAHTHLELSHFREQVPAATNFVSWVRQVIALQRSRSRPNAPEIMNAIHSAIRESLSCGTAIVGDISNTLVTVRALAESALAAVVFYELIRFNTTDAQGVVEQAQRAIDAVPATAMVRASLAAHAPYSVAPDVFRAITRLNAQRPCSVHLAESQEEVEFIRSGTGPWRTLLEELGSWDAAWAAPGGTPVEFLDGCGFLDSHLLAVHGVQMSRGDLARLAERGVTLVTCPRSNAYTGAGAPPVADFYESGVRVAIGTDSLASAPDLNVFAELRELRRLAPSVPAAQLLDSATRQGARGLGFDAEYGTIEAGKSARLIAVSIPDNVEDVEEYLVSGIEPDQVKWLNPQ
jgi:cytosine/adenosine deaminase-related metal-dependent hydrolase